MDRPPSNQTDILPASIEQAELTAERIAALARMGAAVVIGLAIGLSALVLPEETRAYLLPRLLVGLLTMAGFLIVAVLSYLVSKPERYRQWHAYVFVLADAGLIGVALVAGLAISGHSGIYVFAQPAVWLIPIILTNQAIRFRVGPLIFSAVMYVLGLALLLPVKMPPIAASHQLETLGMMHETQPDLVRILMLAVASVVLVYAVRNKRDILIHGIGAARREAALNRFLPSEVSHTLESEMKEPEQRELAILFIDLVGFSRASEGANPVDVSRWLASYRDRVHTILRAHGGFIDKFIGDGVMAIFGYETDAATAARGAAGAIPALAAAMEEWRASEPQVPRFELAVGGALGPVFVGIIGAGERREFTVIGDAVNVAARLESVAKEHGALAALSRDLFLAAGKLSADFEELQAVDLRGHARTIDVILIPNTLPASMTADTD